MVVTKSKWKRGMIAHDDDKQMVLSATSPKGAEKRERMKTEVELAHTGTYSCPFCLHQDKMGKFLQSTKKGFHKSLGKCPECGQVMMLKTLTTKMSPEEFAEWCYEYSGSGYWKKVIFSKFRDRLFKLGIAKRFWARYKVLKAGDDTESYDDFILRKQWEEYQESTEGKE